MQILWYCLRSITFSGGYNQLHICHLFKRILKYKLDPSTQASDTRELMPGK